MRQIELGNSRLCRIPVQVKDCGGEIRSSLTVERRLRRRVGGKGGIRTRRGGINFVIIGQLR